MPNKLPTQRIRAFRRGATALSADHLNSMGDAINTLARGANVPVQRRPKGKGAGGSSVVILTLVTHYGDYLECQDADSNTVYVAKPYELRQTPFDGETIAGVTYSYTSASERDASDGASPANVETQFITPAYVAGAEIYATTESSGDTGVDTGSPAQNITYLEINQGRAWAWDGN